MNMKIRKIQVGQGYYAALFQSVFLFFQDCMGNVLNSRIDKNALTLKIKSLERLAAEEKSGLLCSYFSLNRLNSVKKFPIFLQTIYRMIKNRAFFYRSGGLHAICP